MEAEFGIILNRDINPELVSFDYILESVQSIYPLIEIHNLVFNGDPPNGAELLANNALRELGLDVRVQPNSIEIIPANTNAYGIADTEITDAIQLFASTEGLIADPVYEGRAIRGLLNLSAEGRFEKDAKILLMHLGGSPAIHAYAEKFGAIQLHPFTV